MASGTGSNTVVTPSLKLRHQEKGALSLFAARFFTNLLSLQGVRVGAFKQHTSRSSRDSETKNRSSAFAHTTQAIERRLAKNDLTKVIEVSRRKAFEGQASTLPLLAMLAVWLAVSTVPLLTMLAVWLDVHARARSALLLPIPM